ncbi:interferon-induced GTP-binding protein Mx2-like [Emys orbicularis]|uniref:interferon-induced GTP-binding protein Mx2-like n=1 Tax=Emys orbicularis TaxID=82168 RepID=UPI0031FCB06B
MPAQAGPGTYLMAKESQVFLGGRHPPQSNAAFAASLSTQSQAVFAGSFPNQTEEDFAVPLPPESEDSFVTSPAPAQTNTVFTGLFSTPSNAVFTGSHPAQSKGAFPGYFPAQTKAVFPGSLSTQSKEALTRLQPTESKGATAVPHPCMQNAPPEWHEMIQRHIAEAQWAESGKYHQEKMKQQGRIYHFQEQQNKNTVHTLYNQYEEKIRPCIDLIDSLRALGVEKDLALPAIAVIGDQSSGKSSVLEALSGVALPRGSGIVTRCPLVLRLKKLAPQQEWKGKISYRDIDEELHHPSVVDNEIRKAQNAIAGEGVGISQELISLEISSPNVPDLTLIDLPGIARVAVGNQPQDIGEQIKKLIKKFIAKQETINLVVVPSNVDIATTEALKMAQEVDPDGERTLGILTKPDLVDRGTESSVVDIVQNLVIQLRKGYMIVKCRGQQDIHDKLTLASAIQKERAFFEQHEHFRVLLDENKATIPILAEKLTTELVEHINKSLPALEEQINIQLQKATEELLKYGKGTPKAEDEKLFFLIDKIKLFNQDIVSSAVGEEKLFENEIRLFTKIRTEFQKWGKILDDSALTAQDAMAGEGVGISQELISLEISSPNVPDLTLIDLPGIARVAVGNQPQDIGEQIKKLIKKFIAKQETINLVVVPSNVDIATTEALKMAQEVDPDGERTLGILTKPDLVDRGTESSVVDIVQNLVIHLRKGYMIVKCRGQQDIHEKLTLASAIQKERAFFEQHEHFRVLLDENKATIPILAEKLTTELVEHINKSLPALEEQINIQLQKATEELRKYGKGTPKAEGEKLFFLIDKIKLFNQDIVNSIAGEEKLFENEIRLFTKIRTEFQKWGKILDDSALTVRKTIQHEVWRFEKQYRGRELPGFVSYKAFETIVRQQIMALEEPAIEILKNVIELVRKSFTEVAKDHFEDFHNLNRAAKDKIEDIRDKQAEEAETMIRVQFKMEQLVYCQDNVYSEDLKVIREETPKEAANSLNPASLSFNFGTVPTQNHSAIMEMGYHLAAYFNSAGKRLSSQIPLIIQFYILQDFGDKLQNSMLQLLQEKEKLSFFLQEQKDAADQRHFLSGRIHRLTQARLRLIKSVL